MTWSLLTIGQTAVAQEPEGKMVGMRMRWMPPSAEPAAGSLGHPDDAGIQAAVAGGAGDRAQQAEQQSLDKLRRASVLRPGRAARRGGLPVQSALRAAPRPRHVPPLRRRSTVVGDAGCDLEPCPGAGLEYAPAVAHLQLASHQVTVFGGRGLEAHGPAATIAAVTCGNAAAVGSLLRNAFSSECRSGTLQMRD